MKATYSVEVNVTNITLRTQEVGKKRYERSNIIRIFKPTVVYSSSILFAEQKRETEDTIVNIIQTIQGRYPKHIDMADIAGDFPLVEKIINSLKETESSTI